jgi:hypothetical protein
MAKRWILLCITALILVGCQRFERPTERTGLDKDSHSYSYVSYPETKVKQVAMNVPGVRDVRMEYNGSKIMLMVLPDEEWRPDQYRELANRVYQKVNRASPLNPVHVQVIAPEDWLQGP